MKFIADFHIHSHFSIATSKMLCPEYLDLWARLKGIKVVGTGDFTHPGWTKELMEKLEPAEPGLFKLKQDLKIDAPVPWVYEGKRDVRFILTAEISSIYKKMDRTRKVHNVIFAPDFETVDNIQQKLNGIGNITSDGRPILGLDSRDLLEIALEASENIFFLPAHIWTPWFSALGAKSGFDSIQECYGDLSHYIYAIETGLSSDPPMNWLCSFLDNYTILSNSDAHSPEKLGREGNLLNTDISYEHIIQTIKTGDPNHFLGTLEFFPQEGKYHLDGHRKCGVCWHPSVTKKHHEICSVCGKKVVVGVMNRIMQLADRENGEDRPKRHPFYGLIPLKEILSEIMQVGPNSKSITKQYNILLEKLGPELEILLDQSIDEIQKMSGDLLAEAVRRMRNREVYIQEGYDGEYGRITVFQENEIPSVKGQSTLFGTEFNIGKKQKTVSKQKHIQDQKVVEIDQTVRQSENKISRNKKNEIIDLNENQLNAVQHQKGPALVLAGPGTGKTRVLTQRIAWLIQEQNVHPENVLAVTFTNKAAEEMRARLKILLKKSDHAKLAIVTFHTLGLLILQQWDQFQNITIPFTIIDEFEKNWILKHLLKLDEKSIRKIILTISRYKQSGMTEVDIQNSEERHHFIQYNNFLKDNDLVDLDDLIYKPLLLFVDKKFLGHFQSKYQWILIDEFQDINQNQYELIKNLMPPKDRNLFAIGDPQQAIYGFRGASIQFIQQFQEDYSSCQTYHLEKSYRCSDKVLQASAQMLQKDQSKSVHTLSGIQPGVNIKISQHPTDKSEAEWIARTIENMMGGLRFFSMDSSVTQGEGDQQIESLSDFAVLVRIKSQMETIQKAFNDHSIPYQTIGNATCFDEEPAKSIVHFLKSEYIKKHSQYQPWRLQTATTLNLSKFNHDFDFENPIHQNLKLLVSFARAKREFNALAELNKLITFSKSFGEKYETFFQTLALGRDVDTYQHQTEQVALLTIHASKGLEFTTVFIPGCEEGLIPYSLYGMETDAEEERRLLYVGMTRAKHHLFFSHSKKRRVSGRTFQLKRSPFLNSIEKDLLELTDTQLKLKRDADHLKLF